MRILRILKISSICSAVVLTYILIVHAKTYRAKYFIKIRNTKVHDVWEYAADFSNFPKLDSNIVKFTIVSETGNYERWMYQVQYTKRSSQMSWINLYGLATYRVNKINDYDYSVNSDHEICLVPSLLCGNLVSETEIKWNDRDNSTMYTEEFYYSCSRIFQWFYQNELSRHEANIKKNFKRLFQ